MFQGVFLSSVPTPVLGRPIPANTAGEYLPIEQSSVAATFTQIGWFGGRSLMVVEKPVTLVLKGKLPFVKPYCMIKVLIPAYGPQLKKMLVGLVLLASNIIGVVVRGGQGPDPGVVILPELTGVTGAVPPK